VFICLTEIKRANKNMALSARFDKHTHPRLLKEKTKTITNLASPALKAKVPECARDSGKT